MHALRVAVATLDAPEQPYLATDGVVLARGEQLLDVRVLVVDDAPRAQDELPHAQLVPACTQGDGGRRWEVAGDEAG